MLCELLSLPRGNLAAGSRNESVWLYLRCPRKAAGRIPAQLLGPIVACLWGPQLQQTPEVLVRFQSKIDPGPHARKAVKCEPCVHDVFCWSMGIGLVGQ